jgi:hypothetical protein
MPTPEPQPRSRPRSLIPYLGLTLLLLAAAFAATQIIRACAKAPGQAAQSVATGIAAAFQDAYRSQASIIIHSTVTAASREPKFVVYTLSFTVSADAKKESAAWGLLGTTTTHIVSMDNRAQYYVPIAQLKDTDFHFDEHDNILRVRVPAPILDESMIVVQSDPSLIIIETSAGWASLKAYEGRQVEEQARAQIRPNVVEEARKDVYRAAARETARTTVAHHLYTLLKDRLKPGVKVEVDFHGGDKPADLRADQPPAQKP